MGQIFTGGKGTSVPYRQVLWHVGIQKRDIMANVMMKEAIPSHHR